MVSPNGINCNIVKSVFNLGNIGELNSILNYRRIFKLTPNFVNSVFPIQKASDCH